MVVLITFVSMVKKGFDLLTQECCMSIKGQDKGYKQRVYLLYDGLHYDALGLNPMPDGPEDFDITVFSPR